MKERIACPDSEKEENKNTKYLRYGHEFIAMMDKTNYRDKDWIESGGARKAILPVPEKLSKYPLVAGVLLGLASLSGFVTVFMFYVYPNISIMTPYNLIFRINETQLSIIIAISSAVSAIGAYNSIGKRSFVASLIGCICGVVSFGFLVVGPLLSILALALLMLSKKDFEMSMQGKEF